MRNIIRNEFQAWQTAISRYIHDKFFYRASALAFTTLLALVPFLFVLVFFITIFPVTSTIASLGEEYILKNFVPESAQSVQSYFQNFITQAAHLPTLSIIFLFVTAIMLVGTIEDSLNDIWLAHKRIKRVYSFAIFLTTLLLMPVIIGLSVFLSTYLFTLQWISASGGIPGISRIFLDCIPIFINTMIFSLLYIIVPNVRVHFSDGLRGGFIAALLFEIARFTFALYIVKFPTYEFIYGAFAIIPIFLLWLYIFWLIILFGALLTNAYTQARTHNHQAGEN